MQKLLLCSLVFFSSLAPMAPQVDDAAIDRAAARAQAVVDRMPAILGRIPGILEGVENRERERKAAETARNLEAVADQNTILFATPRYQYEYHRAPDYYWNDEQRRVDYDDGQRVHRAPLPRLAFFKRDLITGGMFLANMASDVAMYKMIKHFRVQRIKDHLLEHHQEVENLLTHIKDELLKLDYQVEDKKMTEAEAAVEKKKAIALIKKFVETEHTLQSVFFNKEILAIIIGRLIVEKASDAIESSLITNRVPMQVFGFDSNVTLPPFMQASYEHNAAGERVVCQDSPISMVTVLRTVNAFLFNPTDMGRIFWADVPDMMEDGLKMANGMLGLGIPKFVFNPKVKMVARFGAQVASLAWAVKIFDTQSHEAWTAYLEKNYAQLLPLLQEYKALKNSSTPEDIKKLKETEDKIEAFIVQGHTGSLLSFGSDYRSWFKSKHVGNAVVNVYQNIVLYGFVAVKAYQMYRYFTAPGVPERNAGLAPQVN